MNHTKLIVFYIIIWCLTDISNCTPIKTNNENSGNGDNSYKVGIDYGSESSIEDIESGSRRSRQAVRDLGHIEQIFRSRRDLDALDTPVDEPSTLGKADKRIDEPNDVDETTVGSPNVSDDTQTESLADEPNASEDTQPPASAADKPNVSDDAQPLDSPADKPNILDDTLALSTPDDEIVGAPNTSDDTSNMMDEIFDTLDVRSFDTRDDTPIISDNSKNTPNNIVDISEEPLGEVSMAGDFVENSPEVDIKMPITNPQTPTTLDEDGKTISNVGIINTPNTSDDTLTPKTSDDAQIGTPNTANDFVDTPEDPSERFHLETPMTGDFVENRITPGLDNTINQPIDPSDDEGGRSVNGETIGTPHDSLDGTIDETPMPNAPDDTTVGTVIASDVALSSLNSRSNNLDDIPNAEDDNKNTSDDTVDTSEEPSEGSSISADFVVNSPDKNVLTMDALILDEFEDKEPLVIEKIDVPSNSEVFTEESAFTRSNSEDTPIGEPSALDNTFSTLNSRLNMQDDTPISADEPKSTPGDLIDTLEESPEVDIYEPPATTEFLEKPIPLDLENKIPELETLKGNEFGDLKSLVRKLDEPSNGEDDKSVIGESVSTPNASDDTPNGESDEIFDTLNISSMNEGIPNISDDNKRIPDDVVDTSEEPFDGVHSTTSMNGDFVGQPIFAELDNRMLDSDDTPNTSDCTSKSDTSDSAAKICDDTSNTSKDPKSTSSDNTAADTLEEPFEGLHSATPGSSDFVKDSVLPTMSIAMPIPIPNDDGESISIPSTNEDINTSDTSDSVPVSTPNTSDDPFHAQISKSIIRKVPNTVEDTKMTPHSTVDTAEETYEGVHFSPTTGDIVGNPLPPGRENKMPTLNPPKRNEFDALELLFIEKLENFAKLKNGKNDDGVSTSTPSTNEDINTPNTSGSVSVSTPNTSDSLHAQISKSKDVPNTSDDIKVKPETTVDTAEETDEGVAVSPTTGGIVGNSLPLGRDNKMPTNQPSEKDSKKEFNELESLFVGKLHELESSFFEKISDVSNHENCKIALGECTNVRNEFDELETLFLEKLHELEATFIGILNDFSNQSNEKIAIDESTSVRNEFDELELLFIKKLEEFSNQRNGKIAIERSFADNTDNRGFQITPFRVEHQVEDNHDGNLDYIMKHILPELEQKMEDVKYLPIYREAIGATEVENRFNNDKYESNISPCPCHLTFDDDHVFQKLQELQNIEDDSEMPMYPSYVSDDFRSNNFPFTDSPLTCDDLDYFY